jgi:hypothetical protein
MPVLWPRTSATILDARSEATAERFGVSLPELFLGEETLLERFVPSGRLARDVRAVAETSRAAIDGLRRRALMLDPSLERPLSKTSETVSRALETFAGKVEAAEARAKGFAPEKLRRLARRVRPEGKPQERVVSVAATVLDLGREFAARLCAGLDIAERRHRIVHIGQGDRGDAS